MYQYTRFTLESERINPPQRRFYLPLRHCTPMLPYRDRRLRFSVVIDKYTIHHCRIVKLLRLLILQLEMVKTLFLSNRQQTAFYLFITTGSKPFRSKDFSNTLGVSRVSFALAEVTDRIRTGDHDLFIGTFEAVHCDEAWLDDNGHFNFSKAVTL